MRVSRLIVGLSAVAGLAAGAFAAGCSSSSSSAPAGPDASTDANGEDAAAPVCFVDASLTMFAESDAGAASVCAACVNTNCSSAITACENSCTCDNLFTCLADAGVAVTGLGAGSFTALTGCIPGGFTNVGALINDPGFSGLFTCLSGPCMSACGALLEAGAPATTTDGGDAATPDAGTGDAGDAGAPAPADAGDGAPPT
jgi:hypothetical protein